MTRITAARAVAAAITISVLSVWQPAYAPLERVAPNPEPDPSILFAGDLMLDRGVAAHAYASSTGALFAGVRGHFASADASVVNLEGTITRHASLAQRDHTILRFTFDPMIAREALSLLGVSAVSLANNHSYDFGRDGYDATQEALRAWGVSPFGHPVHARDRSTRLSIRGKSFCLSGYHGLYDPRTAEIVTDIKRLRPECYRIIVFAHWGNEYESAASAAQVAAAREFVDAGADLVIGAHPHVVQNIEVYRGKAIVYSLGNFMFDQDFSWATTHGLMVKATFAATSTSFELIPIRIKGREVAIADGPDAARVLAMTGRPPAFTLGESAR